MRLKLEDFTSGAPQPVEEVAEEDSRHLAAYEEGYAAGWEDAVAAQANADAETAAEVARNLQSLSLLRDEARRDLLRALEPLLAEICTRLLPETARLALGPVVAEALLPIAAGLVHGPIRLGVAPASRGSVEAHLARVGMDAFVVVEDASLSPGKVTLLSDGAEAQVDLDAATTSVIQTIRSFLDTQDMERQDAE